VLSHALLGFNDWANIRLDQIGGGRRAVKFQDGDFADFGSGDFADFGSGDFADFGSGDFVDFGSGDFIDFGSGVYLDSASGDFVDFGSGDFADFGSGDFADFGSGDFLDFGSGNERQELDYDAARGLGKAAPYALVACIVGRDAGCAVASPFTPPYHRNQIRWQSSTVGHVFQYLIQRKTGTATSNGPYVLVGTSPTTSFSDLTELPNGAAFTYRVRTEFDNETPHTFSSWSQPVTIVAVDDAPIANPAPNADNYNTTQGKALNVDAVHGVLVNDTDDDSPATSLRAVLLTPPATYGPSHGTVTLNPDGSFTYVPAPGFKGSDSFRYKEYDACGSPAVQCSDYSNVGVVTITVAKSGKDN